jgi:hypothetical protein
MQKPDLDRLWRIKIYLKLPASRQALFREAIKGIASQVTPLVSVLEKQHLIDWYYFLIHGDPESLYFDVVVSLRTSVTEETLKNSLKQLAYCSTPERLHNFGKSISDIATTQLINDDILEAWKLIGEQSKWVINLVNAHKDSALTIGQFKQFMHFFTNSAGLGNTSFMTVDGEAYYF